MKAFAYILLLLSAFTTATHAQLVTNRALYRSGNNIGAALIVIDKDGSYFFAGQNCSSTAVAKGSWTKHRDTLQLTPTTDTAWTPTYSILYCTKRKYKDSISITIYDKYNEKADPPNSFFCYHKAKKHSDVTVQGFDFKIELNMYTTMLYNGDCKNSPGTIDIDNRDISIYFNIPATMIDGGLSTFKDQPVKYLIRRNGLYDITGTKLVYNYN